MINVVYNHCCFQICQISYNFELDFFLLKCYLSCLHQWASLMASINPRLKHNMSFHRVVGWFGHYLVLAMARGCMMELVHFWSKKFSKSSCPWICKDCKMPVMLWHFVKGIKKKNILPTQMCEGKSSGIFIWWCLMM